MSKKKFNQTKVGAFLSKAAPGILDLAGDVLPDAGVFGLVKNLIHKDPVLPVEDKEKALKLLEQDMIEMQEVSKRWESDMKSDSWLSKNTRPMSLIFLSVKLPPISTRQFKSSKYIILFILFFKSKASFLDIFCSSSL